MFKFARIIALSARLIVATLCWCLTIQATKAQNPLNIGDSVSDVEIKQVSNHSDSLLKLSEFKGKYVLLDFWTTGCGTCINKMPLMDSLQKEFGNKIQIILVNSKETKTNAVERLEKIAQRKNVKEIIPATLPSSIGDTLLNRLFPHIFVPHHVWIGPDGRVLYITSSRNTTRENVKRMIHGEQITANEKTDLDRNWFKTQTLTSWIVDNSVPTLVDTSGFTLIAYHENMEGPVAFGNRVDSGNRTIRFTYPNVSLPYLYNQALPYEENGSMYGISTNNFLFDTRWVINADHPAWVKKPRDASQHDAWKKEAVFSCELVIPIVDSAHFPALLKQQLDSYVKHHHGVSVRKQRIETACLFLSKLTAVPNPSAAKEKGDERLFSNYLFGLRQVNRQLFEALNIPIVMGFEDTAVQIPYGKVHADLTQWRAELNRWGYDVQIQKKRIDMMVVENIKEVPNGISVKRHDR